VIKALYDDTGAWNSIQKVLLQQSNRCALFGTSIESVLQYEVPRGTTTVEDLLEIVVQEAEEKRDDSQC